MKKIFITLLISIYGASCFAQTVILQNTNPMQPYQEKSQGKNRKHYTHTFLSLGLVTPVGATMDDTYFGKSLVFDIGVRYRYRISNFLNIGSDFSYYIQGNRLDNSGMEKVFDGAVHDRENIIQNELRIAPFFRFNLTPHRGDYLGTYIDLGGYIGWNFLPVFRATDTEHNGNEEMTYTRSFDPNQNRYDYGVTGRIARNKYLLFATYRLSDIMKKSEHPDLPRLSVGVQFGF